jgi:hypothetical protein
MRKVFRYLFLSLFVLSGLRFPVSGLAQTTGARTPIRNGVLQNDLDAAGHKLTNVGATGGLEVLVNASGTVTNVLPTNYPTGQLQVNGVTIVPLTIGANVQAWDADLDKWALTTPPTTYAVGDVLFASAANTIGKLADVSAGNVLLSGGVATAPSYGKVTSGHVDSSIVPSTRTVAGHALSSNVTVTAADVGAPSGSGTSTGTNTGDQIVPANTIAQGSRWFESYNSATGAFTKSQPTFTDLAAHPTTIGGYGIGDFNSLGDARWQPLDADLTIYAGITPSANVQTLLGAASFSAFRTSLGVAIGTDVEAHDNTLTALAGVTTAANKLIYATGADAFATTDLTSFGRSLIDDADATAARATLGLGTLATQSGTFSGTSSGTNTGDQTSVSGNAGTATALQTARTINGVSFNGTANITVPAAGTTLTDTVPVSKGGTGVTTLTQHGVLIGKGASIVNVTDPGTAGQVLTSNGASADPTFQTPSGGSATTTFVLLSSTTVATDEASAQTLYTVPTSRNAIVTNVVLRKASASLAFMGDSVVFGFNGSSYTAISGGSFVNIVDDTRASGISFFNIDGGVIQVIGSPGDPFQVTFQDHSITATVVIDVFGYLVDSTTGVPIGNVLAAP